MKAGLLHVISCYSNPIRWAKRLQLTREFENRMVEAGIDLTMVECQLGNRPWELNNPNVHYHRVRHRTLVWTKENLINLGVEALSDRIPDWKYLAWVDADVAFNDPNWASETVHALQQYPIIQPWNFAYDLGPQGQHDHMAVHRGFCYSYVNHLMHNEQTYEAAHPGYAWAIRRRNFYELGGLIETAALGAADRHMAYALIGCVLRGIAGEISHDYKAPLVAWQQRAQKSINRHIGYLTGSILHYFHGSKPDRQYMSRWQILARNNFTPVYDLERNEFGVIELTGNKPKLTAEIEEYFRTRNEDANSY